MNIESGELSPRVQFVVWLMAIIIISLCACSCCFYEYKIMSRLLELPLELKNIGAKLESYESADERTYFFGLSSITAVLDIGCSITVYVLDTQGVPMAGMSVRNARPDGRAEVLKTNGQGAIAFFMGAGSHFAVGNQDGPHAISAGGDLVYSLGLPDGHHCDYVLTFRQMTLAPQNGTLMDAIGLFERGLSILRSLK